MGLSTGPLCFPFNFFINVMLCWLTPPIWIVVTFHILSFAMMSNVKYETCGFQSHHLFYIFIIVTK